MSLKLKLNTGKASSPDGSIPQSRPPPTPSSTSAATPGGGPKVKLSFKGSLPPTPATEQAASSLAPPAISTKKPSKGAQAAARQKAARAENSKKRTANDDSISPAPKRPAIQPKRTTSLILKPKPTPQNARDEPPSSAGPSIKLKGQRRPTQPILRTLNVKRPPPQRLPGLGYDSEDSDAEEDPAVQQGFVLRMQPGDDCDYVREAITNGKIGLPSNEGGAEISMRFLDKDCRRAIVTVRGRMYAAALVDLPCIVETMKSWDKKGWWKVADISQMLLVLGRCSSDDEAKNYPLPREVDKHNMQYAHGLTPPMHWVRKRRFRKRLSYKTIANVEEEVERLLKEDELAESQGGEVTVECLDRAELERSHEPEQEQYDDEMDAEGEAIETVENGQEYEGYYSGEDDIDLEGDLQAAFDEEQASSSAAPTAMEAVSESPAPLADQAASYAAVENAMLTSDSPAAAETPADITTQDEQEESSDEDYESEEDDDDPDVLDEDAAAKAAERNQQLEEVADLEREVEAQKKKVDVLRNQLLKDKALAQLRTLEEDLRVKRGVFGLDDDEEGD